MSTNENEIVETNEQLKGSILDTPIRIILQNVANSLLLVISELTQSETYVSWNSIINVFLKENRVLYIGLFIIFLSVFLSIFFG